VGFAARKGKSAEVALTTEMVQDGMLFTTVTLCQTFIILLTILTTHLIYTNSAQLV